MWQKKIMGTTHNIFKYQKYSGKNGDTILKDYTIIHELNRDIFSEDDMKFAVKHTINNPDKPKCSADICCRLTSWKDGVCYLHGLLDQRRKEFELSKVNEKMIKLSGKRKLLKASL